MKTHPKRRRFYVIRGPESKRRIADPGWWPAMQKEMRLQDAQRIATRRKAG